VQSFNTCTSLSTGVSLCQAGFEVEIGKFWTHTNLVITHKEQPMLERLSLNTVSLLE
jgi:hypothetical protein